MSLSCDVCGRVYNPFIGDRFRSSRFAVEDVDGCTLHLETLCEDCHRTHVKHGESVDPRA